MGVSLNGGTPKSSILIGFSIINYPFWGTTILGNPNMFIFQICRYWPTRIKASLLDFTSNFRDMIEPLSFHHHSNNGVSPISMIYQPLGFSNGGYINTHFSNGGWNPSKNPIFSSWFHLPKN